MTSLKYYGHACFSLTDGKTTLLFDPFFTDNPWNIAAAGDISADFILISHGHFDHLGDSVAIAKRAGSNIISTAEICNLVASKGCERVSPMHIGGKINFPFGWVRVTPAFHGSGVPGGHAAGFIVNFNGKTLYFAGDTSLFGDMKLLGDIENIDYALLPIGNNFTMGPEDAVIAADFLRAKNIVPMHYDTWPPIKQDPAEFKRMVEKGQSGSKVIVMPPGESIRL